MKEIDLPDPKWTPCLLTFEGCGNVKWLVRLPVNQGPIKEVNIIINHPWTYEQVDLKYKGQHPKRPEVFIFTQDEKPEYKGTPRPTIRGNFDASIT